MRFEPFILRWVLRKWLRWNILDTFLTFRPYYKCSVWVRACLSRASFLSHMRAHDDRQSHEKRVCTSESRESHESFVQYNVSKQSWTSEPLANSQPDIVEMTFFCEEVVITLSLYLYIYIYIYIYISSCHAISTGISDPLAPHLLIAHCFRLVLWATYRIGIVSLYVGSN